MTHSCRLGAFVLCWLALIPPAPAPAGDWPQYRGPGRDGKSTAPAPAALGQPEVGWRRPIGEGFSALAVVGNALVTLALVETAPGTRRELALRFDADTGSEVWRRELGPAFEEPFGNGPRSTPTVVDDEIYALSSHGVLAALRLEDGAVRWRVDLPTAIGGKPPRFGYSPSPLVVDDLVLLQVGAGEGRSIAAFDRKTGEPRWTNLDDRLGYSSPIALQVAESLHLVFVTPTSVVGVSPAGDRRWHWQIPKGSAIDQPIAMPVAVDGDKVFVAHRSEGGSALLQLANDEQPPTVLWQSRHLLNHMNSSVAVGGHLYGFHNATLKCLDAQTGRQVWAHRGLGKGSLIAWGEHLLILSDEGQLVIAPATPEQYRETARTPILTGRAWTAPSLAEGRLYARNHHEMVRVDLTGQASATPRVATATLAQQLPTQASARVDAVLAAHRQALGGDERLATIHSLRLTGRQAESSRYSDFTLLRQRPNRYRLERRRDGQLTVHAFDGASAWWIDPSSSTVPGSVSSPMPSPMPEAETTNLMAEVALHGPLAEGPGAHQSIELIGTRESETGPAWELRLTRHDGAVETWLLDRDTYLASERISTYRAYGESWQLHTHYSDYRAVEGLMLPHLIEMEFSSLHQLMRIERVEVNPELDPASFIQPPHEPKAAEPSDSTS